ncbi:MAG: class I SAM-dependent methyltransferase [Mycobacteriaceae bacterium]
MSTRWFAERTESQRREYAHRFTELAEEGNDVHGEARLLDVLLPRGAAVLDAGCGTARVGAELARRGHRVTAVDADELLVAAAERVEGLDVRHADLAELELRCFFDAVVVAGNVLVYLQPGTERTVLRRLRAHLQPGGLLVTGFATDRDYTLDAFDADTDAAGLVRQHRFATWDLQPWTDGADWSVTVLRAV